MASTEDKIVVRSAVYNQVCRYLSNGYGVIYAAESRPPLVIRRLSRLNGHLALGKDIEEYVKHNDLSVVDRNDLYLSGAEMNAGAVMESWRSLVIQMEGKKSKHLGIVAIGNPSVVLHQDFHDNIRKLVNYEAAIGETVPPPFEAICLYDNPDLNAKLSFTNVISILSSHYATIHHGWFYREWHPSYTMALVYDGIDRVLGQGMAKLVFKTLKLIYNLEDDIVLTNPEVFEQKLKNITGEQPAQLALELITSAIIKEASFNRIAGLVQ
ncbi:MAG TPA: MEDS domain-containing protein [Nitrososphaera sp.]|jgi:hypothetical protein|nr:MEDS domain-containing protein [Nitrososphaera sp.]